MGGLACAGLGAPAGPNLGADAPSRRCHVVFEPRDFRAFRGMGATWHRRCRDQRGRALNPGEGVPWAQAGLSQILVGLTRLHQDRFERLRHLQFDRPSP